MSDTLTKQSSKKSSGTVVVHRKSGQWGVKKAGDGVVNFCVRGPTGKIVASDFTPSKLIEVLRVGLPVQELHDLQASLAVPMEKLFPMLGSAPPERRVTGESHEKEIRAAGAAALESCEETPSPSGPNPFATGPDSAGWTGCAR